jgi:hypothetical protein
MGYKILHLPTATYMYRFLDPSFNNSKIEKYALFSQYELELAQYDATFSTCSTTFSSKELALEHITYWYKTLKDPKYAGAGFLFFENEVVLGPKYINFLLPYFEIIEVDDEI